MAKAIPVSSPVEAPEGPAKAIEIQMAPAPAAEVKKASQAPVVDEAAVAVLVADALASGLVAQAAGNAVRVDH